METHPYVCVGVRLAPAVIQAAMAALFKKMSSKEAAQAAFRSMDKNGDRALEVSLLNHA
eukprot:COSAG05_NODE_57_length_23291_cov_75.862668_25_plen_59_part_00